MEIEHKLTEEHLQALFQGKKLVLEYSGQPRVTLYPPRYGVFMTHEKFSEMEQRVYARAWEELTEFLKKIRKDS
jgi:hypothetical protein